MMGRMNISVMAACAGIGLIILTGCAEAPQVIPLDGYYKPLAVPPLGAPMVVVQQVEDKSASPEYQRDPTYLGPRLTADVPRADLVRSALATHLSAAGLVPVFEVSGSTVGASEEPLRISTSIQRFSVIQRDEHTLETVVSLECRITELRSNATLWQGSSEGTGSRIFQAIDSSVEKCVTPAVGLGHQRRNEAYAKLLQQIKVKEATSDWPATLNLYVQAYRSAMDPEQTTSTIAGIARVLRKMPNKPALSEEARKFGVQANSVANAQQYDKAIELYEKALDLAPWWAEGHFNRALLLADQNLFPWAIAGMKRYLHLAPNNPDSRAAQDKIYEWELKAK